MDRYALVVGIAQYNTKNLVQLEKPTKDAEAVAQVLEQYGNFTEVKRLPYRINPETKKREMENRPVTRKQLWQEIEILLKEQARNNDALIYFTGHGLRAKGLSGKPRGYLATSDCQIDFDVIKSEGNKDESRIMEVYGGIPFDALNHLISQSELSSLVVLLDCCHSGDFIERNLIAESLGVSLEKDYHLIAACRGFQKGKALKSEAHSVFTGALLRGLRAENASSNGEISCDRLYDYISRELKGTSQQPLRLGWGTSIILVNNLPVTEVTAPQAVVNRDNPYLGLMAFDAEKKDYFFGRKAAVKGIVERLRKSRFLAVIGPSGCGKSSLVKAGVLPKLKDDPIPDSSQWQVKIFTPGRYPLEEFEQALASREPGKTFLLFIDQFEELFTLCSDESQRREFISKITEEATKTDGDTRVIVAIRGDFLDRCAVYEETANLINCTQPTTYVVTPMTAAELTEAIEQPAAKHAITFESGLVEQIIINVVNQAGALPLLQYALEELWRVCITDSNQEQTQLTFEGYEQIGGVKGALEKRADELYQDLAEADRAFVRRLFLELVQPGENQEVTRRHASRQNLLDKADSQEQLERVTRQLSSCNHRLIITDENKVEVAHEALLSEWRLLRKWIEDNRDNIRLERRLEVDCQEWNNKNRPEGLLLTGTWLAAIDEWVKKEQPRLSLLKSEFLRESLGRRDRVDQKERERLEKEIKLTDEKLKAQKQRTKWAIASGILLTFTLGLGLLTNVLEGQKREQEAGKVGVLIGKAQQLLENNLQLEALIASVEALKEMKNLGIENQDQLQQLQSVIFNVQERNQLKGHQGGVYGVSFSPDGTMIASGGVDGRIIIWNQAGKRLFSPNEGHKEPIWSVRFSPDSQFIASASIDNTINIWSKKGELIQPLKGHKDDVYDVTFSKNSDRIFSSSKNGSIIMWDVKTGRLLKTFQTPNSLNKSEYRIMGLDLEPFKNSVLVYTGNKDYEFSLLDMIKNQGKKGIKTIGNTQSLVMSVRFNKKGNMIVSSENQKDNATIKIWDITGNLIGLINSPKDGIVYAEFSYDSKYIASASVDQTVKIWKVDEALNKWKNSKWKNSQIGLAQPFTILAGHTGAVNRVSFNPLNSQSIASASDDGTVRLWEISGNKRESKERYNLDELLTQSCKFLSDYSNMCKNLN
ncbi:hypothetical protein BCD67_15690 [Oscillatoriales cyanobacterium USR001]|nr:hypothetical protein BCD67_15690 [Oscillatoriales cyanobacterium USR001]